MKLFLVTDETRFYHPDTIADFLRNTKDEIVGAGLVTKISKKSNLELYLIKHWYYLRFSEMVKLVFRKYRAALKDIFIKKSKEGPFYSIRSVYKYFKIDFIEIENNINESKYLDIIRKANPDVIVSSNSLIFKEEILNIPSICCINLHSALLPSYGGLWPVLQAYRRRENFTGVSVHAMTKKIDEGIVLAHKKIKIEPENSIADLYQKCFEASSDVMLHAIEKIKNNDLTPCSGGGEPSYFSFPNKEHWDEFRKRGGRFV